MTKYGNMATFKSVKEAKQYPYILSLKTTKTIRFNDGITIPCGKILEFIDYSWDVKKDFVIAPLYGVGDYRKISRRNAVVITDIDDVLNYRK